MVSNRICIVDSQCQLNMPMMTVKTMSTFFDQGENRMKEFCKLLKNDGEIKNSKQKEPKSLTYGKLESYLS